MTKMNTTSRTTSRCIPRINLGTAWLLVWLGFAAWFGFGREWLQHNPAPAQAALNSSASRQALAAGQSDVRTGPGADAARLANTPKLEAVVISKMKVGDQIPADNPTGKKDTEFGDTVDPPSWRKLVLIAPKKDGSFADVELLRPLWWLDEQRAETGGTVEVHVPECGIEGRAKVLAIEACPTIKHDSRFRIVTGTFRHQASKVLDVYVEGLDEPIGTTPNHPFWSEDRQTFVRADELKEGEHLRAFNGTPIVRRVVPLADPEPVFNLEVQCDHVYHVARNGVLVHNGSAWDCYQQMINGLSGARREGLEFFASLSGRLRRADGIIDDVAGEIAVESKRIGNWSRSVYNPANTSRVALERQFSTVLQMKDYASTFQNGVRYYTNNADMAAHLKQVAKSLNLDNVKVFLQP